MAARRNRRRRRRNRGRFGFLYKLLSVLLICAAILAGCVVFFRVDTIVVTGQVRYTEEEIIAVAGVERGENLFRLNKIRISNEILRELPYVFDVSITRKWPDTLLIHVSETAPAAAIQGGGAWWLMDARCKLLARGDAALPEERPEVLGLTPLVPAVGTRLAVDEAERGKLESLKQLLLALHDHGLSDQVTSFIDLTANNEICFGFGENLSVVVPMNTDFDQKIYALRRVQETYAEQQMELRGTLDLTYGESEAHILPERRLPAVPVSTPAPDQGQPGEPVP